MENCSLPKHPIFSFHAELLSLAVRLPAPVGRIWIIYEIHIEREEQRDDQAAAKAKRSNCRHLPSIRRVVLVVHHKEYHKTHKREEDEQAVNHICLSALRVKKASRAALQAAEVHGWGGKTIFFFGLVDDLLPSK